MKIFNSKRPVLTGLLSTGIFFRNSTWILNFSFLTILLSLILSSPLRAQKQKKIYILTDLEGVSGVYKFAQTREKGTPLNIQACEYFMDDLAAVIRGLRDGGATEILVLDGHGNQCIIPDMMVPGAKYVTGIPRPKLYYGLDSSYVGMVQFGAHAMMGTKDGVLNHTMSSKSEKRYWYNGVECGELAIAGMIAGYYGVPTIMVTGDEAVCREARKFFGNSCVTVAVKKGIAREAAVLYPFKETRKALYEGAKKAMEVIPGCKPYSMKLPIKGKLQYIKQTNASYAPEIIVKEAVFNDPRDILRF